MAVQAQHLCLFPQQTPLANREMANGIEGNGNMYGGGAVGYGLVSGTTMETLIPPMYGSTMKSDSGLTYSIPAVSRKRPREAAADQPLMSFPVNRQSLSSINRCGSVTFLGEDICFPFHQSQLEIDQIIAQHTAKVRMEMEERRKSYSRRIITAVEESIMKKLRAKEEEINKIGKLNWALEERVKSLCVENQIWRELAQTNEATANALRNNLEQVLMAHQVNVQDHQNGGGGGGNELMDDAESCCGSTNLVTEEEVEVEVERQTWARNIDGRAITFNSSKRLCRNCGKDEASVLLLPCRHLCLCYVCGGSALKSCPVCLSTHNATLHVNFSSNIDS
ncbi:hypothetical protein ACH5RR_027669 [Cinchona calisaya]|uniref:RING-type domain-containing protein n=1 Tax=Cinchona calisaya TaxID=153742 RepID=A0ABD2YMR2_9GENT